MVSVVSEETGRSGGSLRARAKGAGRRAFTVCAPERREEGCMSPIGGAYSRATGKEALCTFV